MIGRRRVVITVLAAVALGIVVTALWIGTRETRYVWANERIARTLPIYPGAAETDRTNNAYYLVERIPPWADGWNTSVSYRVPGGTSFMEVIEFYEAAVDASWDHRRLRPQPARLLLLLCRENDTVLVVTDRVGPDAIYQLIVDHNAEGKTNCGNQR